MTKKHTVWQLALGLWLLCGVMSLQAKPVEVATARRVAERLLNTADLVDRTEELAIDELYLFSPADGHGFVVVAADDCAMPVVGWSPKTEFRTDVAPAHAWLMSCAAQIADMRRQGIEGSEEVASSWREHLEGGGPKATVIEPLMTTTWNQDPLYQQLTPYDNNYQANCLAGCGAVAMAQVMKYWNHPAQGRGSHSYYLSNYDLTLSADFDTTYAWDLMPDELTSVSPQAQIDAVNLLLYHVGISIEMEYTAYSSNSYVYFDDYYGGGDRYSIERALPTFFRYRSTLQSVTLDEYTRAEWDTLLMTELRAARPIIYRGADPDRGGHIFVLDGCDARKRYHFNWGWGSYCDGYFFIGSLNPGGYQSYDLGNCAIIGIEPLTEQEEQVTLEATANNPAWGSVEGDMGTFTPYGSEARLIANARDGYRFDHWSDGSIHNPRFFPICESRHDTAVFVPAGTDTVGLCLPRYRWGYGYSDGHTVYGAVKLPIAALPAGRKLGAVRLFAVGAGSYTVSIHSSVVYPSHLNEIFRQSFTVNHDLRWETLTFDSLVTVPAREPLWLVIRTENIPYSIAVSRYGGNTNSFWFSSDGNRWYDCHAQSGYLSAILQGLFVDPNVAIEPVDDIAGVTLRVNGLALDAAGTPDADLMLYDLAGRLLCASRGSLHYQAPVAGVYLLQTGNSTHKIILQ